MAASLDESQLAAVHAPDGPVVVQAGPGSGKTRVIVHRLQFLVEARKVDPGSILCCTFTNKACAEMRHRARELIGSHAAGRITFGTFHHIGSLILRRHAERAGVPSGFTVADDACRRRIMRDVLNAHQGAFELTAYEALQRVSEDKMNGKASAICGAYDAALSAEGKVDFDDLLVRVNDMLAKHADVLDQVSRRYVHVLVDEYQDTNRIQYELARRLASVHGNLTVVGDPDQSIYSWRHADPENLNRFARDFPSATVVALRRNYRSTQRIVMASRDVLSQAVKNESAKSARRGSDPVSKIAAAASVQTGVVLGPRVAVVRHELASDEADAIAESIQTICKTSTVPADGGRVRRVALGNMAVLVRTNQQMRDIERSLGSAGLAYRTVGATSLFGKAEVRDVIAYVRLAMAVARGQTDAWSDLAFERVVNTPKRGLGVKAVERVRAIAGRKQCSLMAAAQLVATRPESVPGPALGRAVRESLTSFVRAIARSARAIRDDLSFDDIVQTICEAVDYSEYLHRSHAKDAAARMASIADVQQMGGNMTVEAFLQLAAREEASAVADAAASGESSGGPAADDAAAVARAAATTTGGGSSSSPRDDAVTICTLHGAKGLEYAWVWIPGCEEGLIPHAKSAGTEEQLDEERRLLYVGMTRAKVGLSLSYCDSGGGMSSEAAAQLSTRSRFLDALRPSYTASEETVYGTEELAELVKQFALRTVDAAPTATASAPRAKPTGDAAASAPSSGFAPASSALKSASSQPVAASGFTSASKVHSGFTSARTALAGASGGFASARTALKRSSSDVGLRRSGERKENEVIDLTGSAPSDLEASLPAAKTAGGTKRRATITDFFAKRPTPAERTTASVLNSAPIPRKHGTTLGVRRRK